MYSQTNIVSFDAARRRAAAQSRTASPRSEARRDLRVTGTRRDGVVGEVRYRNDARDGVRGATAGRAGSGSARVRAGSAGAPVRGSGDRFGTALSTQQGRRGSFNEGSPRAAIERFDGDEMGSDTGRRSGGGLAGRLREGRRARTKERADKAYFKQYEAGKPSDASQGGPRAAVYKGEMGSTHKRSSRMQQTASSAGSGHRGFAAPSSKRFRLRTPLMIGAACVLCAVFAVAVLYAPAQQFYHDLRQKDRLAAEYTAVVERNEAISQQVESLQTDAGVEDQARMELGWVKEGEHAVSVAGLETERESTFRGNIVSEDVPFPDTWYSGIFDPIFGVGDEATSS